MTFIPLESYLFILKGVPTTVAYTCVSLFLGLILGTLLALAKTGRNRILASFATFYLSIFRGTPLFLQLTLVYYSSPWKMSAFVAGTIAFSFNSGAYVCEIIRSGIQAIDQGQYLAAQSLGLSHRQTMFGIILPQAFRNVLPALINESVSLLKESSLISALGGEMDLLRRAQIIGAERFTYFEPLMVAAACYYALVSILVFIGNRIEKRIKSND